MVDERKIARVVTADKEIQELSMGGTRSSRTVSVATHGVTYQRHVSLRAKRVDDKTNRLVCDSR